MIFYYCVTLLFCNAIYVLGLSLPPSNVSNSKQIFSPYRDSANRQDVTKKVVKNVGSNLVPVGSTPKKYSGLITSKYPGIAAFYFKSAVEGYAFSTKFLLAPDTYDVELGFVQDNDCSHGQRIFHIYINGYKREESLDVFGAAGCSKALVLRYNNQIIDPITTNGIKLSFEAVSGVATLSYIRIQRSDKPCVPDVPPTVSSKSSEDHFAHSVPGTYPEGGDPSFVDRIGLGYYKVKIDGSGSHTHFSANGYTAKIKSYVWTREDTGKVISTKQKFTYNFPLGTTVIRLKVTDTVCSEHEETTSITVTGSIQKGIVCYIYVDPGTVLIGNTLQSDRKPVSSFVSKSLKVRFPVTGFKNQKFAARCVFLVMFSEASESTKISVNTTTSGLAHIYRGPDRIFDSSSGDASATVSISAGLETFEITYYRMDTETLPVLSMKVDGKIPTEVFYDYATTLPIITSLSPNSGSTAGSTEVRIFGYNLHRPIAVFFGKARASVKNGQSKSTEVVVVAPAVASESSVKVNVRTGPGYISNELDYSYGNTCDDVKFDSTIFQDTTGKNVVINQPTAVTIGHDGNLYVATLEGQIHSITYDHQTAIVNGMCHSEKFQDSKWKNGDGKVAPRAFLGITLDPRDSVIRPYVSASTIFYHRKDVPISRSNPNAWSNGAVERFKPATKATRLKNPNQCLEHDKNIIQGLPVANGDHSVNQVLFTQGGDLLIAVGGRTNMGLPQIRLGGSWETYFSGAVLIAKLSKPSFQGKIPYTTPTNLRTARPKGDYTDVDLYATGLRNPFAMTMSRSGRIYAGDNGPNKGFGDASSTCVEYNETIALKSPEMTSVSGGGAIFGSGADKYTAGRQDKILMIKNGKYYGHPNLQRSAILGVDECAYIDPLTGKTPPPGKNAPPSNYEHRLAMMKSPITGMIEYGGNEFCGNIRGTLMISKLKSLGTYAVKLNPNGKTNGEPYLFNKLGGLSVVEDSTGSLIFPKYQPEPKAGFIILKPQVSDKNNLYISGVSPFRHGKKGGTQLFISGRGFSSSSSIDVGGKPCIPVTRAPKQIVCKIPSHSRGPLPADVVVKNGAESVVMKKAILYMQV